MTVENAPQIFPGVNDRRDFAIPASPPGVERRQFADAHADLTPEARELAKAVDEYKIRHRRRFVTHEELLAVMASLGYKKS